MENLPKNWVIDTQAEKDSPLIPKFMEWFDVNKSVKLEKNQWLGLYNGDCSYWENRWGSIKTITLEQWNAFYFPEWEPKQGERVLVRDSDTHDWEEEEPKVFVCKYRDKYFVEDIYDSELLNGWKYAKPLPKESTLQPIMDQLKAEAQKLGLKVNITVE